MDNHSPNHVLHAKSKQFYWHGDGQLSIKTFSNGKAHYKTNKGFYAVEDNRYLLLNEGTYTISIDETSEVESFCLFFKKSFAEEVLRTQNSSPDNLLSDPYKDIPSIGFYEKTYDKNVKLTSLLQTFKQNLDSLKEEPLWLEEQFHKVMQEILIEHQNTIKEVESLHALRASTREEIYKRISTAHDYIRAFYNQVITLDDIAKIACLSPNHLLRNYNKIYGRTPYQHISELRIIKAKELLSESSLNMTGITFELGFGNPVSFSKMFKQHTGISPLQFRKKVILDKK